MLACTGRFSFSCRTGLLSPCVSISVALPMRPTAFTCPCMGQITWGGHRPSHHLLWFKDPPSFEFIAIFNPCDPLGLLLFLSLFSCCLSCSFNRFGDVRGTVLFCTFVSDTAPSGHQKRDQASQRTQRTQLKAFKAVWGGSSLPGEQI